MITITQSGIANHQGLLAILDRVFGQPVDSLPLTLWKYAQQPYPERVNQAWAVALVLMILVLTINVATRLWIQRHANQTQGN